MKDTISVRLVKSQDVQVAEEGVSTHSETYLTKGTDPVRRVFRESEN